MISIPVLFLVTVLGVSANRTVQSAGPLSCRGLVATYAIPISEDRDRPKVDTSGACRALVVAVGAIKHHFHRKADSISWRRVDVPDSDTKKITSYYQFVFALDQRRPNVIVSLPSFRARIMDSQ